MGPSFQKCHCTQRSGSPLEPNQTMWPLFSQDPVPGVALAFTSGFLEPLSSVKWHWLRVQGE